MNIAGDYRDTSQEVDLGRLVARFWRGRMLIAGSVVIFTLAFGTAAFLMTPVYRATTVLAPVSFDQTSSLSSALGSVSGLASLAGIELGGSQASPTERALAVLRSREFTQGFIADQQLMPELYADVWDAMTHSWKASRDKQPTLAQAAKYFDKLRTATVDKKTGLVRVDVEWTDPDKAAAWANELVARLNRVMRERALQRTEAHIGYLQKELDATSPIEARNAIGRLMESQINHRMLANVSEEYAFQVVDKALPPERDDRVRPRRKMLAIAGAAIGLFAGIVGVLVSGLIRQ